MAFLVRLGTTSTIATNGSGVEGSTMITISIPSTYKTTSATLVDSGRNQNGEIVANVIRSGVRSIEMSWLVIGISEYSKLASFFNSHFSFYAYYFDMDTNSYLTKNMYVGDRVAEVVNNKTISIVGNKGFVEYIKDFSLSLIEV